MSRPLQKLQRFLRELKRRNVYKVAIGYLVAAFVALQAADLLVPETTLPAGTETVIVYLTIAGFPIALVIAWAFEVTPEGVRRTPEAEPAEEGASEVDEGLSTAYKLLVGLGLVAAAVAGGWYLTGGGGEAEPRADDRSIAVLPFENMGGKESEQFTQGVHDGLLTRLSNISDLKVISRTSVMQYEGTDKTVPQIARELGAQWVVEGAVQQAGGQVQVNAQLIQAREDAHQWAETYRRELNPENLFAIQSELTKKIARSLAAELSPEERERVERQPTTDLTAYQLYARGRQELARRSDPADEHVQEAVHLFRRAIEQDSSFALAWSGLADAAAYYPSEVPDSVVRPEVSQETAARRALKLEPDLAEAHASMGYVHYKNHNAPAALRELRRAIELKPSYWEAHQWLGWLYVVLDRREAALEHFKLAVDLNPQHARARHGLYDAYNWAGLHEKALREARRQKRMGLEHLDAIGGEVRSLNAMGRVEKARDLAEQQVGNLGLDRTWGRWFRVYLIDILAQQGDTARAREYLNRLRAADVGPQYLASAYRNLGEVDRALEVLKGVDEEYWGDWLTMVGIQGLGREYPSVRSDSRYQELLREAHRYWGLNPDGSLPDSVDVSLGSESED